MAVNEPLEAEYSHPPQPAQDGFLSSRELAESPWPIRYILLGLGILALCEIIPYLFRNNTWFIGPWFFSQILLILSFIFDATLILFVLLLFRRRHIRFKIGKLTVERFFKELYKAFIILLIVGIAILPVMLIVKMFFKETVSLDNWRFLEYTPGSVSVIILFLISSFTVGPLAEELFFRGFLYNALKSRLTISLALLLQAAIFALIHPYSVSGRIFVFLFGIALAIVYEKRQSLLAPIFVHGLKNSLAVIPFIFLLAQNYHVPAATWPEAKTNPAWVSAVPSVEIKRQEDGLQQWQYAINQWGSKGSRKWKKELNAFNAVSYWFPGDREACAKAELGKITIYNYYLRDYRRAIIEADYVLANYPEKRQQVASALSEKGVAYLMLRDFRSSRESFNKAINEYKDYQAAYDASLRGIKLLDKLENK